MKKTKILMLSGLVLILLAGWLMPVTAALADSVYPLPNFLFTNPDDNGGNPNLFIGRMIGFIVGFVGLMALIMFIYGGVLWLVSGGREDYVKKGTKTMSFAAIGLIVIFSSYIVVNFVISILYGA